MENYFKKVQESARFLKKRLPQKPKVVLVLSGGLQVLVGDLKQVKRFHSTDIPHFPKTRVEGHDSELIFGLWHDMPLLLFKGRFHYYEGLTPQEVVFPYFVTLGELGAEYFVTTNAVGGIRADLHAGDIMLVTDHINIMGNNPLIGLSVQRPVDQFPSMQRAYDAELTALALMVARAAKVKLKKGVYLGTTGPSYETPAEIKAFRKLGADTVGMSTIFENIAARFLKKRVLTLNIVANPAADRHKGTMKHSEVLSVVRRSETQVLKLLKGILDVLQKEKS